MILRKLGIILATVALLASVVTTATPSIALAAGGGPADALNASGEWAALNVGQQTWYGFRYPGDGSQVFVRLSAIPGTGATFSVLTPDEVQQWQNGATLAPIGMGTPDSNYGDDLTWSGHFDTPGIYYVKVDQAGNAPANYGLTVSGSGVSLADLVKPEAAKKAAATTEKETTVAKAAVAKTAAAPTEKTEKSEAGEKTAAKVAVMTGANPGEALTASGKWETVPAGKTVWYAIPYAGDGSQLTVRMAVDASNPASFAVWTPGQVASGGPNGDVDPVGRGSADTSLGGDLIWSGAFDTAGTYYVTVTGGATPAGYQLTVK